MNRDYLKELLLIDPETGKPDGFGLQARCVGAYGPAAGVYLQRAVFLTGRSALEGGYYYKSKAEMQVETGLSIRQQDKARKVLKAKEILEERRPNRRGPAHYRVDLLRLARMFGLVESSRYSETTESTRYSGSTQSHRYSDSLSRPAKASELQRDHRETTEETFTASSEFSPQIPVNDGRKNHRDRNDDSFNDMIGSKPTTHRKSSPREPNDETSSDIDASTSEPQQELREDWLGHPLDCECVDCAAPMPKYVRNKAMVAGVRR